MASSNQFTCHFSRHGFSYFFLWVPFPHVVIKCTEACSLAENQVMAFGPLCFSSFQKFISLELRYLGCLTWNKSEVLKKTVELVTQFKLKMDKYHVFSLYGW
jgi:hypothetical protein